MEIWKDVIGYEGAYEVSNLGNVRSLDRYILRNGANNFVEGKILKPYLNSNKYLTVSLSLNGKRKTKSIHSLVALCFLNHKSKGHKIVIDHINNIKTDNRLINLQLLTNKENINKMPKGSSKYVGVHFNKINKKWIATKNENNNQIYIGSFLTEKSAYKALINN